MAESTKNPPSHAALFNKMDRRQAPAAGTTHKPEVPNPDAPINEEEKKPEEAQAAATPDAPVVPEQQAAEKPKINLDEVGDEEFLELYKKRTGRSAESIDELKAPPKAPTQAEIEAAAERERTESLEWALGTQAITRDQYEKSIAERSKSKRDIAYALFAAEAKVEDKDITPEETEDRFRDFYGENEEPNSWKYKKGQALMNSVADNHLSQYSDVDSLPEKYREFKTTTERHKGYTKLVNKAAKELPKELTFTIEHTGADGAKIPLEYKIPVEDKILAQVVREYANPSIGDSLGDKATPEFITKELDYHVRGRMLDQIIPILLEKHGEKVEELLMVKIKNIPNPGQPPLGQQQQTSGQTKTPPSHAEVFEKMPKK